jgi:hypothetical protein
MASLNDVRSHQPGGKAFSSLEKTENSCEIKPHVPNDHLRATAAITAHALYMFSIYAKYEWLVVLLLIISHNSSENCKRRSPQVSL